jgi:hypothetical protein
VRFRQYKAYSEKEWNYVILANKRSETVRFLRLRGIRENQIMFENFTLHLTKFLKVWTWALSFIE